MLVSLFITSTLWFTHPVAEDDLPITLPAMTDFKPTGTPEPPLSKAKDWLRVEADGE